MDNKQASTAAKRFLAQFQTLFNFAQAVAEMGDVDSHTKALIAEKAELEGSVVKIKGDIKAEQARLAKIKEDAGKVIKDGEAARIAALRNSVQIVKDAKDKADKLIKDAEASVKVQADTAKKRLYDLQNDIAVETKRLQDTAAERARVENALADLKKKFGG